MDQIKMMLDLETQINKWSNFSRVIMIKSEELLVGLKIALIWWEDY